MEEGISFIFKKLYKNKKKIYKKKEIEKTIV